MTTVKQYSWGTLIPEDIRDATTECRKLIYNYMKEHIGSAYSVTIEEIYKECFGEEVGYADIFVATFWKEIVRKCIRELRCSGRMFIVNHNRKCFVLKTSTEARLYKDKIDKCIITMGMAKRKADAWVRNKKWQGL